MELHPSKVDRVRQDGSVTFKERSMRSVREVVQADASTSTHQNVAVQMEEEVRTFVSLRTLAPSGTWRRRQQWKPYRGRASMTDPIAHNSTQEKGVQADARKIISITSLQSQLQKIREKREAKKEEEKKDTNSSAFRTL